MSRAWRCWVCVVASGLSGSNVGRAESPTTGDEREIEAEMGRFSQASREYRSTVEWIIHDEQKRHRRAVEKVYQNRLKEAARDEKLRRDDAVTLLERFLADHPDDARASPDAMYRLAELYFERDREAFLEALELAEAASSAAPPAPDHSRSIALYRGLIARFPDHRHIDTVHYLLGYCEEQMNHGAAARAAWLGLVCPTGAAASTTPYTSCRPLRPGSRHLAETWLRLGEQHFDLNELAAAAAAYQHVLEGTPPLALAFGARKGDEGPRDSPWFDKALYKLAWALYRADRLPEAVARFDELLALPPGRGGDLRPEAVQYLAICFAEPRWTTGKLDLGDPGLPRIDAFYRGRSAPYARDVYEKLGDVLFEETEYARAVDVYRAVLERWPLHPRNPKVQDRVILALDRVHARDAATREREVAVTRFAPRGPWGTANRDDEEAIGSARALLEGYAAQAAVEHHRLAQQLAQQARASGTVDVELQGRATLEYRLAAAGYRAYLAQFPSARHAHEYRFFRAEALYYAGQLLEAAREYEVVRDSLLGEGQYREEAAFFAVKAREKQIELEVAAGQLRQPALPSVEAARAEPLRALDLPPPLAELQAACDAYVVALPQGQHAAAIEYKSAEIDFRYGRFPVARRRLASFIERRCKSPDNLAIVAEEALLTSLAIDKDLRAVREWLPRLDAMACGVGMAQIHARQRRAQLAADVHFLSADARFSAGDLDAAAGAFLEIANQSAPPNIRDHRAEAFFNAGLSHEKMHRSLMAVRIFERLADELPEAPLVDEALYHAAQGHERLMDLGAALRLYRRLADDPRHRLSKLRGVALKRASLLLEYEQRYAEAATDEVRHVQQRLPPLDAAEGWRRAAALHRRAGDTPSSLRALRAALRVTPAASPLGLQIRRELAEALEAARDLPAALALHREVVAHGAAAPAASEAADHVAASMFRLAEERFAALERRTISDGEDHLRSRQRYESERLALHAAYGQVLAHKRAAWTLAAYFRQGHLRQLHAGALARLLTAPCPSAVRRRFGDDGCQLYAERLEQTLAPDVVRLEQEATDHYRTTLEQAARLHVHTPWTALARRHATAVDPTRFPPLHDEKVALSLD